MKSKKAFTMAEVLVVLGIIGVVASAVLPARIVKYQKRTTVEKLHKVMSELNQAVKLSEVQNGDYYTWQKPGGNYTYDQFIDDYWIPYLKVSKRCTTYSVCGYKSNVPWKYINGRSHGYYFLSNSRHPFMIQNGMVIYHGEGIIKVDLNGGHGPNIIGKDVFFFQQNENGSISGLRDDDNYTSINTYCTTYGTTCMRKIELDDWQIKDDYPWK